MSKESAYTDFSEWAATVPQFTQARQMRLWQASGRRTEHLRLVIQDTHHPHNIAACLRSAEAFGIQHVDIVNVQEKFKHSNAAKGVVRWLTIQQYRDIESCVQKLRSDGYKIAAAFPHQDALALDTLPLQDKIAIVFGNEHAGVHAAWKPHLDFAFTIPMCGLVESLNISVSCAITLHQLRQRGEKELGEKLVLNPQARRTLLASWTTIETGQ